MHINQALSSNLLFVFDYSLFKKFSIARIIASNDGMICE
jgi:hypothetical protein